MAAGHSVANHGNKGRQFRLALPRADYCRFILILTPVKRPEGPKLHFCFCRPLFLIPSRTVSTWAPHGPKLPSSMVFLPPRSRKMEVP